MGACSRLSGIYPLSTNILWKNYDYNESET